MQSGIRGRCSTARIVDKDEALTLVRGRTEKPFGVDPARWFGDDGDHERYALGVLPLTAFAPNEAGTRYDATVEEGRALDYASRTTPAPPVVAVLSRDETCLRILDGGHRISAARMRGAEGILAIVRFKPGRLDAMMSQASSSPIAKQGWIIDPASGRAAFGLANRARYGSSMDIFIASHDSRHFSFDAFGSTEKEAREAFQRGLDEHARQHAFRVSREWADEVMAELDVRQVQLGAAYRDREPLAAPAKAKGRERAGPTR